MSGLGEPGRIIRYARLHRIPDTQTGEHRPREARVGPINGLGRVGPMRLYCACDRLMAHREAIEPHLFDRAMDLFDLRHTVTLYDLTNTDFEDEAHGQAKARRGHSKDKRTDCPLLTLGRVLDASGFVRRSQVFAGHVSEHDTLAQMLDALDAPRTAVVVMDRGVATEDRLHWLREQGYRSLVVSRERTRHFDPEAALRVETALTELSQGLSKPRTRRRCRWMGRRCGHLRASARR